jgi:hypothetical protein
VRRLWLVAVIILALAAVWAAHLPLARAVRDFEFCDGPEESLASLGMHLPSIAILVMAAFELIASFAPSPSSLPVAIIRRPPVGARLAAWARSSVEAPTLVALRPLVWLLAVLLWFLVLFALGHYGNGAAASALTHFLLAVVLCFRPRRPVRE